MACSIVLSAAGVGLLEKKSSTSLSLSRVENPWDPTNPHGIGIILTFWLVVGTLFIIINKYLIMRPLYRNVPEGADANIDMLPGGSD